MENDRHESTIGIIGMGKIGSALAVAIAKSDRYRIGFQRIIGSRTHAFTFDDVEATTDTLDLVNRSDVVILAVKQEHLAKVASEIKDALTDTILISVVAGTTIERLHELFGTDTKIVRVMTNIGCIDRAASSAYSLSDGFSLNDEREVKWLLDAIGIYEKIEECQMNAFTLTSCKIGIDAYTTSIACEVLEEQGIEKGVAKRMLAQSLIATGRRIMESESCGDVVKEVASKGGMTEAIIDKMEECGVRSHIKSAYLAGIERGVQLNNIVIRKEATKSKSF